MTVFYGLMGFFFAVLCFYAGVGTTEGACFLIVAALYNCTSAIIGALKDTRS